MTAAKLKKAAILIASLDAASADALLEGMDPEAAARVRNAVMELGEVDPQEQRQVMQDFVTRGTAANHRSADDHDGVELHPSLAEKLGRPPDPPTGSAEVGEPSAADAETESVPFCHLEHVDVHALAKVLVREHPQTVALVVAHLAPDRAAHVLQQMPIALQAEVLARVARLGPPRPEIVRDVALEMKSLLAPAPSDTPIAEAGVATVEAILRAAPSDGWHALVARLARRDAALARQLALPADRKASPASSSPGVERLPLDPRREQVPGNSGQQGPITGTPCPAAPNFRFADLESLDDVTLARVLRTVEPATALLALAGASHALVQRILRQLPAREAGQLHRQMQQLGPLRLDDVERAQTQLAEAARALLHPQAVSPGGRQRFAAAA